MYLPSGAIRRNMSRSSSETVTFSVTPWTPACLLTSREHSLIAQVSAHPPSPLYGGPPLQQLGLDVVVHANDGDVAEQWQVAGQVEAVDAWTNHVYTRRESTLLKWSHRNRARLCSCGIGNTSTSHSPEALAPIGRELGPQFRYRRPRWPPPTPRARRAPLELIESAPDKSDPAERADGR